MVAPTMIKEHMEVLGADGVHVGTVDKLDNRSAPQAVCGAWGCRLLRLRVDSCRVAAPEGGRFEIES